METGPSLDGADAISQPEKEPMDEKEKSHPTRNVLLLRDESGWLILLVIALIRFRNGFWSRNEFHFFASWAREVSLV